MTNESNALPLLGTKLHRPQVTENLVARPHLLEHLHSRRQRSFTVVSAPAGYGKTTLISNWLEDLIGPVPGCRWMNMMMTW
jgi:LuxR family maltose regulon positive regulatory protein